MTRSKRVGDEGAVSEGQPMVEPSAPRAPGLGSDESWTLYILRCRDGSLYAGITIDLERRVAQHQDGTASRYTRSRRPVTMVYRESCASRSDALKREFAIKALSRQAKERLISGVRDGSSPVVGS